VGWLGVFVGLTIDLDSAGFFDLDSAGFFDLDSAGFFDLTKSLLTFLQWSAHEGLESECHELSVKTPKKLSSIYLLIYSTKWSNINGTIPRIRPKKL